MLFQIILFGFLGEYCVCLAQENPLLIFKDESTLNISFRDYNVINSSGQILDNATLLLPLSTVTINIVDIPASVKFVLLQAHSFLYNVTLSYDKILAAHTYTNGTDVGLIQLLKANQKMVKFVLFNSNAQRNATVLIAAQGYGKDAPVPGGCNMEFSVEIAPFLSVAYNDSVIRVECQPASAPLGLPFAAPSSSCEMRHVELEMYHVFMPEWDFTAETYFAMVREMMTVYDIRNNGRKVEASIEGSPMRRVFSAYPGTGSVFAVIAVDGFSGAAYVPAVSYGCDILYGDDECQVLTSNVSKIFLAILLFLGLFMCFFGHQYFKCEMFLLGFLAASLVSYILVTQTGQLDVLATQGVSVAAGLIFGCVWLVCWCLCGIPVVSVFLSTLTVGFLLASIVMYAGAGDYQIFDSDINFWVVFCSLSLTVPILMMTETHTANILCCGVLGAFGVILAIDHYIGSNLKYILLNTIRRATVKEFKTAEIDPPFQMRDLILVCVWFGLAALGVTYQLHRESGRPPFPSAPRRPARITRQRLPRDASHRTPLMSDARRPYGATAVTSASFGDDNVFVTPSTSERRFTVLPNLEASAPPPQINKELF